MTYLAGKNYITDETTNQTAEVGLFGGLKVSVPTTHLSYVFDRHINLTHDFILTTTGVGSVNSMVNRSLLEVNASQAGDTALIETKNNLIYKTAATIETYFTASFTGTTLAGDSMLIGLFDAEDGVYIGYDGLNFIAGYRNVNATGTGTEPDVTQIIDVSAYDLTKIHRFRIRFGYLGVGNIYYEIHDGSRWNLLHLFQTDAALQQRTHIGSPSLPMSAYISNTTAKVLKINSGSWNAQSYSNASTSLASSKPYFVKGNSVVSVNAGQEATIVAFKNTATLGGAINKYLMEPTFADFATNSEGLYRINFYVVNESVITDGTWVDFKPGESLGSYNVTSTYNTYPVVAGDFLFGKHLAVPTSGAVTEALSVDFATMGVHLHPGEVIIVSKECLVQGAGSDITSWVFGVRDLY